MAFDFFPAATPFFFFFFAEGSTTTSSSISDSLAAIGSFSSGLGFIPSEL
jgi:hypothetical protein